MGRNVKKEHFLNDIQIIYERFDKRMKHFFNILIKVK